MQYTFTGLSWFLGKSFFEKISKIFVFIQYCFFNKQTKAIKA